MTKQLTKNVSRSRVAVLSLLLLMFASIVSAAALDAVNPVLRPPKGTEVAIVVFEDLQCPQCRRVAPILEQASKTYKIPLIRHDFPLPMHNWSYDAAVMARFFDETSKELGNEFRVPTECTRGSALAFPNVARPVGREGAELGNARQVLLPPG